MLKQEQEVQKAAQGHITNNVKMNHVALYEAYNPLKKFYQNQGIGKGNDKDKEKDKK